MKKPADFSAGLKKVDQPAKRAVSCAITNSSLVGRTIALNAESSAVITPDLPKRAARLRSWSNLIPNNFKWPNANSRT